MVVSPRLLFILLIVHRSLVLLVKAQSYWNLTVGSTLGPLGPDSSVASPSGDFAFGFLPLDSNASLFLLAVWFNATSPPTVVWFASNGSDPVRVPALSALRLTRAGQLSLSGPTGQEVWNPGPSNAAAAVAALFDSGNLILYDGGGMPLWQSFDAPTNTLLPGQFLSEGSNLRSKLTDSDYSRGRFRLAAQNDGNLALHPVAVPTGNVYKAYWATNTDSGTQLVFDSSGDLYYLLGNNTRVSIAYTTGYAPTQYYKRATLDPDGVLHTYVYSKDPKSGAEWAVVERWPADGCGTVKLACGPNALCKSDSNRDQLDCECPAGYSFFDLQRKYKGCKPNFAAQACDGIDKNAEFEFVEVLSSDWPGSDYEHYTPIDDVQCRELCMSDCFCAGVVIKNADCWKLRLPMKNGWQGSAVGCKSVLKVAKSNASAPQQSPPNSTLPIAKMNNHSRSTLILILIVFLGVSLFTVALTVTSFYFCSKKRNEKIRIGSSMTRFNLRVFTYKELEEATEGFSEELGRGAFGIVYKGIVELEFESAGIAVKKFDRLVSDNNESEFMNEVRSIGQTHHKNLVKLFGFCNEGTHRMLVYEYMSNGSLTSFLFGSTRPSWNKRAQIATGIARGLVYLHEECGAQIIHCDIKPQNILLDEKFNPKISDFGLAKLLLADQTRTNTGIRGTKGYVAPEWFKNSSITAKVDVYSFGVVLLEIICCRKNVESSEAANKEAEVLSYWAYDCYRAGRLDLLVERDEEAKTDMRRVERFIMVAIWCIQEEPSLRPSMQKVGQMLEEAITVSNPPDPSPYVSSIM